VLKIYERRDDFDEILSLLEAGLSLERAHGTVRHFSVTLTSPLDECLQRAVNFV